MAVVEGAVKPGRLGQEPEPAGKNVNLEAAQTHRHYPTVAMGVADEKGLRSHMEDRHTLLANFSPPGSNPDVPRTFLAVYDGHSSALGSEHASRRLHEYVAAQPAVRDAAGAREGDDAKNEAQAVAGALKAAFEDVDEEIIDVAVQKGKRYGTTAVCGLVLGDVMYVAHCGDSRAVLCRDGAAAPLTRDHKPASVPEERRRIQAKGGRIAFEDDRVYSNPEGQRQSRLNMSRALGDPDHKSPRRLVEAAPDVACIRLEPRRDEFLVLGSDGLFERMDAARVVGVARHALGDGAARDEAAARRVAEALVKQALKAGSGDNITAAVALFDWGT